MSTLLEHLDALVAATAAGASLERVTTEIVTGRIDGASAIVRLNEARTEVQAALDLIESALGVVGHPLVVSLLALSARVLDLVNVALRQSRNPLEITTDREMSVRRILFEQLGSLDRHQEFVELNARLPSFNFVPAGTTLRLPRT